MGDVNDNDPMTQASACNELFSNHWPNQRPTEELMAEEDECRLSLFLSFLYEPTLTRPWPRLMPVMLVKEKWKSHHRSWPFTTNVHVAHKIKEQEERR